MDSGSDNEKLNVIQQADKFLQRLHDLEIVFKPRPKMEEDLFEISKQISIFSLRYYDADEAEKEYFAKSLLMWVNMAYAMGFIDNGEALYTKISDLEKQNKLLQERLDEYNERIQQLETERQDTRNYFPDHNDGDDTIVDEPFR